MAGLISELVDVMSKELEMYENLMEASKRKKSAVINNDLDKIRQATADEQSIVGKIQRTEKSRLALMKDIASILNVKEADLTVSFLIDSIKEQPDSKKLKAVSVRLKEVLGKIKILNDSNAALVNSALEYIDYSINVVRSTFGDSSAAYAADGVINDKGGFVDARH